MEELRGKIPRRVETSEPVVPFHSSEASTAAASDNPTGERLYLSMTEEGPSGDYKNDDATRPTRTMDAD